MNSFFPPPPPPPFCCVSRLYTAQRNQHDPLVASVLWHILSSPLSPSHCYHVYSALSPKSLLLRSFSAFFLREKSTPLTHRTFLMFSWPFRFSILYQLPSIWTSIDISTVCLRIPLEVPTPSPPDAQRSLLRDASFRQSDYPTKCGYYAQPPMTIQGVSCRVFCLERLICCTRKLPFFSCIFPDFSLESIEVAPPL